MRARPIATLLGASGLLLAAFGFLFRSSSARLCGAVYAPVCGADGSTYGNACKARAAGVVYRDGACTGVATTSTLTSAHALTPTLTAHGGGWCCLTAVCGGGGGCSGCGGGGGCAGGGDGIGEVGSGGGGTGGI